MNNTKNVLNYFIGKGSISKLQSLINEKRVNTSDYAVIFVDHFFRNQGDLNLKIDRQDMIFYYNSQKEPTTDIINHYKSEILSSKQDNKPVAVIAIGGGSTLDTVKAVSNLLNNPGVAEDYQGWDLVKNPGIYKIGVPTISGTGAEASRTCVMTNYKKNLKLGMNSEFTIYDQLILDSDLSKTVPRDQYFYTAMDTYIHCIESLNGSHRHAMADSYSYEALRLCHEIFSSKDMMSDENREKLMVASYHGGASLANSFVGVVHPFSAGLSIVFGTPHCLANCIIMSAMEEFYPVETEQFKFYVEKQGISIPSGLTQKLDDAGFQKLYESTIIHEKPLTNALGENFKTILSPEKVRSIFERL